MAKKEKPLEITANVELKPEVRIIEKKKEKEGADNKGLKVLKK